MCTYTLAMFFVDFFNESRSCSLLKNIQVELYSEFLSRSSTYIWSGHCTKDCRFRAMNFANFIKSCENCEEIALYYSNVDIVIYHSTNIHSSESAIFGTVATPYVCRTPCS